MRPKAIQEVIAVGLTAILFYLAAKAGLMLSPPAQIVPAIWPPSGLALAAVLLLGRWIWPGILLGAGLAYLDGGMPPVVAMGQATGSVIEVLVAATLIRRYLPQDLIFHSAGNVLRFALYSTVACLLSATLETISFHLTGMIIAQELAATLVTAGLSGLTSILILTPFLMVWVRRPPARESQAWLWERMLYIGLLLIGCVGVVTDEIPSALAHPVPYVLIPFIVWAAFRFDQRAVSSAVALIAAANLLATLIDQGLAKNLHLGTGAFLPGTSAAIPGEGPTAHSLLELQTFLAIFSLTGMAVSAVVVGRRAVEGALLRAQEQLEARVRIRTEDLSRVVEELRHEISERQRVTQELRRSKERYRLLADFSNDWVYWISNDHRFIHVSPSSERITGYTPEEFVRDPSLFLSITHPDDRETMVDHLEESAELRGTCSFDYRIFHKDGHVIWLHHTCRPILSDSGESLGRQGCSRDISARKTAEGGLRESEANLRALFESTQLAIVQIGPEYGIKSINSMAQEWSHRISGLSVGPGDSFLPVVPDELRDEFETLFARAMGGESASVERRLIEKDGREPWLSLNFHPVREHDGRVIGVSLNALDISDRRRAEEQIAHLAYHDMLTGLPNRLIFQDRMEQAIAKSRRSGRMLGLLFLDLDDFKEINDRHGHGTGDHVLRKVAHRLVHSVRRGDTVVRMGGDEFVVLLDGLHDEKDADRVGRKILAALQRPVEVQGRDLPCQASIGISVYPLHATDPGNLLRNADTAMYKAKALGGNRYVLFTSVDGEAGRDSANLQTELRLALERNEFVVHYQPLVEVETGRVRAVEALVRWQHPTRGLLPPAAFMQEAEDSGLIVAIGMKVLRDACTELARWDAQGLRALNLCVNLSLRQFQDPALVDDIARILGEIGIDPSRIELEVNEGTAMANGHAAPDVMGRLRAMGLHLSLDDFGSGSSSLQRLMRLPIESIKIDRSFIQESTQGERGAAAARGVITMAQSLRLKVVAEGVERPEQLEFLRREGCGSYQGFLFSPAVPGADVEKLLSATEDGGVRKAA